MNEGNLSTLLAGINTKLNKILNGSQCVGFEQLLVTTAVSLNVPANAASCRIDVDNVAVGNGNVCRYRFDGINPTTSIGNILGHLDVFDIINDSNMRKAIFISVSGTTKLNVTYFK